MKLAYAVNYYLPAYPIAEKHLVLFANKEHFIWPDPSIKANFMIWQNAAGGHLDALAFMIKMGAVVPNPKYWGITVTTPPKTITVPATPVMTKTITATVPAATTVTKTVTITTTALQTTTVTTKITEVNWGVSIGLLVLGLIIGVVIGYTTMRKR